ncbi:hypothetical protein [Synechococcus sp. PCC 6312]|uniref:hypothetical protein n=1 Tax=Synechococcus sp. (strain ATCC 27167 / PCC 6312) TaxID=195253 RepID=UPI00029ED448|nr:hypothetical protein [Synechococcus sp. PCC 6312]AFY61175.1 hypothetical protein Syn6312_2044 [Synechococcus sp. PCC 6312]
MLQTEVKQTASESNYFVHYLNGVAAKVEMLTFSINPFCNAQSGQLTSFQAEAITESLEEIFDELKKLASFAAKHS